MQNMFKWNRKVVLFSVSRSYKGNNIEDKEDDLPTIWIKEVKEVYNRKEELSEWIMDYDITLDFPDLLIDPEAINELVIQENKKTENRKQGVDNEVWTVAVRISKL